jgi:anti-sigma factor RsiW
MTPVRWDWTYLIHRHLEGSLEVGQARALNSRLLEDPALCRRLAELAFERTILSEPVAEAAVLLKPRAKTRKKPHRRNEGRNKGMN